jgi:hypothetical protein
LQALARVEIVAYNPSPIFRTDANPISATAIWAMRESPASDFASRGSGSSWYAAASTPHCDVRFKKTRRENKDFSVVLSESMIPPEIAVLIPVDRRWMPHRMHGCFSFPYSRFASTILIFRPP